MDLTKSYTRLAEGRIGLRRLSGCESGGLQLLLIPFAGGQSLAFAAFARALPQDWTVWAVDPPGHGWAAGLPLDNVRQMVDLYLAELPPVVLEGAVLMGHSLGGCVAYDMARRMLAGGMAVRGVILSATRPPGRADEYDSYVAMDDGALLKSMISIGGIPAEWAAQPKLFRIFKGALRADLAAFEAFTVEENLTGLPIRVFGGRDDPLCRPEHIRDWSQHCLGCEIELVDGGHLFVQTHPQQTAQKVKAFVEELDSPAHGSDG